jgi:hypothetical protein
MRKFTINHVYYYQRNIRPWTEKGSAQDPVVDGHRFTKYRSRSGNAYYKCILYTHVAAKLASNLTGKTTLYPLFLPTPTNSPSQTPQYTVKHNLKRKLHLWTLSLSTWMSINEYSNKYAKITKIIQSL